MMMVAATETQKSYRSYCCTPLRLLNTYQAFDRSVAVYFVKGNHVLLSAGLPLLDSVVFFGMGDAIVHKCGSEQANSSKHRIEYGTVRLFDESRR